MVNRFYQGIVSRLRMTIHSVFGVIDRKGEIVACSDESRLGTVRDAFQMEQDLFYWNDWICRSLPDSSLNRYAVFLCSTDEKAVEEVSLLAAVFEMMAKNTGEKESRSEFLKRVIYGEVPKEVLYEKMKEAGLSSQAKRYVVSVHFHEPYSTRLFHLCDTYLRSYEKDFIFLGNENQIIVVKEVQDSLPDMILRLEKEHHVSVSAGISFVSEDSADLPEQFEMALLAMKAACASDPVRPFVFSDAMGMAGIVASLSREGASRFLNESCIENLFEDEEMLFTIRKFLENHLNVSETAKELFITRNTMIYRLNKIQKETGRDLRNFEDAMVFKTALMVRNYLNSQE